MNDNSKASNQGRKILSEEMEHLINSQPNWIVRNGNTVFFLILLMALSLTFFIRYPDIIKANVRLVAINAPILITTKDDGKLTKLIVRNEEHVTKGQQLAFMESTAEHEQVLALQKWILNAENFITKKRLDLLSHSQLPTSNELGEIQPYYEEFKSTLQETLNILESGYYDKKKNNLQVDLKFLKDIQKNVSKRKELVELDLSLQRKEFEAKESLAKDKVIAPLELNQDRSKLIVKEQSLRQISSEIISNKMENHNKEKELLDLNKFVVDQEVKFSSALLNLKSKVDEWAKKYIISSPVDGKVLFVSFLQQDQQMEVNQELFYIEKPGSEYYAELYAGQNGFGKVKNEQMVIIKVESYPVNEFGYLSGKISFISDIPSRKDSFLIRVDLQNGLKTNSGKSIFFRNNLSAQADIVTDNRRLSERFIGQFFSMLDR